MHTSPASPSISRRTRLAIALAAAATALLAGACSTDAEITPTVAVTDTSAEVAVATSQAPVASEPDEAVESGTNGDINCVALHEARMGIQGAGGGLIYAEDAEYVELVIGGPDAVAELLADVDTLRPYQDVDAVPFGPIREGLDNFANDLNAATEGRFGEITGGYNGAGINGLLAELGC